MRIVHFSDLHIGVETYGRPLVEADLPGLPEWFAPGEARERYLGQSTRLVDFLAAFDELIDYAIGHAVDLVLFTGDAYKNRDPSQTHQREFAKRVRRLAEAGVPVFCWWATTTCPTLRTAPARLRSSTCSACLT